MIYPSLDNKDLAISTNGFHYIRLLGKHTHTHRIFSTQCGFLKVQFHRRSCYFNKIMPSSENISIKQYNENMNGKDH